MSTQLTLGDFAPPMRPELSQYFTPRKLARKLVAWANPEPGALVLEPSAGSGSLVKALVDHGARVEAYEIDGQWVAHLEDTFVGVPVRVRQGDFLGVKGIMKVNCKHDLAVMNPPLDGGVGALHVKHALRFAPRAVAILRSQDLHGLERYQQVWSKVHLARVAVFVRRPAFVGKGGSCEFVAVDVYGDKRDAPRAQTVEYWTDNW